MLKPIQYSNSDLFWFLSDLSCQFQVSTFKVKVKVKVTKFILFWGTFGIWPLDLGSKMNNSWQLANCGKNEEGGLFSYSLLSLF